MPGARCPVHAACRPPRAAHRPELEAVRLFVHAARISAGRLPTEQGVQQLSLDAHDDKARALEAAPDQAGAASIRIS
ncbi:hypothetical protein E6R18_20790 [Streptomyces sp. A1277]|uniref:hypothetical protein n=1 Tax=Streptomyces sp. A1277 TaxID=2563103 RepID=UPI0010A25DEA|nr:hypothetical protein [Streptomyces sp. A1277]THA30407.1 hypothetical protein E6R18_20790 [Streptomyces sp. A1277]